MITQSSRNRKYVALGLLVTTIVLSFAGSAFLIYNWKNVAQLENHGYLGLFLISLLAGSPIPIPTPSMIFTFTLGSILNPVLVGAVSGLGNAIGIAIIYWTGRAGLRLYSNLAFSYPANEASSSRVGRFFSKIGNRLTSGFSKQRGEIAIFLLSIYPNPVLTPMVLGMGATRFPFSRFIFACWAGKTTQTMLLAYMGYFGLRYLLRYIGIFNAP
jgi:membrane protein YqaA with SNARE-associated domain